MDGLKSYIAEGVGTFALVFIGCGTAALMTNDNQAAMLIVAIAFALALMIIIYAWGILSGAHVNPVISLTMAFDGRISYGKMGGFWLAQFIGAILAATVLLYIFGSDSTLGSSIGSLTYTEPWKAVFVEAVITFFLVSVVLSIAPSHIAGIAIGGTLGMGVLFGYLLTGGSMNPARSFGPALISGNLENIWIYFIGPLLGALVAYGLYYLFFRVGHQSDSVKVSVSPCS